MAAVARISASQGQSGQDPETDQGVAGGQLAEPGQQRGQRRLVDVTEGQVVTGGEEVELVAT